MAKEKNLLIKKFKAVVEDLLDNYDNYTEEEKNQIKEVFKKVADLNAVLDKYDVEKKGYWAEFIDAYGQYFNLMK
jgi:hypothetical protein